MAQRMGTWTSSLPFLGFSFIDKMRSLSSFESPNSNRKFTLHFPLDCFTRERQ